MRAGSSKSRWFLMMTAAAGPGSPHPAPARPQCPRCTSPRAGHWGGGDAPLAPQFSEQPGGGRGGSAGSTASSWALLGGRAESAEWRHSPSPLLTSKMSSRSPNNVLPSSVVSFKRPHQRGTRQEQLRRAGMEREPRQHRGARARRRGGAREGLCDLCPARCGVSTPRPSGARWAGP